MLLASTVPDITVIGDTIAERPIWAPPSTTHRLVTHAPDSIMIGRVMSPMSRR